jgi:plastocyanin
MHALRRLAIALVIVLAGLALVPFVALPSGKFSWQQFSGAYQAPDLVAVVEIRAFAYTPNPVIIPIGGRVRWVNRDPVAHTATSNPAGEFDSGTIAPGGQFEYQFNQAGTYSYTCTIHPAMTGKVIVSGQFTAEYLPLISH